MFTVCCCCPTRYPVEGYRPMQAPPTADLLQTKLLIDYTENLVLNMTQQQAVNHV